MYTVKKSSLKGLYQKDSEAVIELFASLVCLVLTLVGFVWAIYHPVQSFSGVVLVLAIAVGGSLFAYLLGGPGSRALISNLLPWGKLGWRDAQPLEDVLGFQAWFFAKSIRKGQHDEVVYDPPKLSALVNLIAVLYRQGREPHTLYVKVNAHLEKPNVVSMEFDENSRLLGRDDALVAKLDVE